MIDFDQNSTSQDNQNLIVSSTVTPDALPSGLVLFMVLHLLICISILLCGCKNNLFPQLLHGHKRRFSCGTAHILPFTNIFNDAYQQYQYDCRPHFMAALLFTLSIQPTYPHRGQRTYISLVHMERRSWDFEPVTSRCTSDCEMSRSSFKTP